MDIMMVVMGEDHGNDDGNGRCVGVITRKLMTGGGDGGDAACHTSDYDSSGAIVFCVKTLVFLLCFSWFCIVSGTRKTEKKTTSYYDTSHDADSSSLASTLDSRRKVPSVWVTSHRKLLSVVWNWIHGRRASGQEKETRSPQNTSSGQLDRWTNRSIDRSIHLSINNQSIHRSISEPTNQSTDRSVNQITNQSTDRFTESSNQSTDW